MKLRQFEIMLEKIQGFSNPNPAKEQYLTPPTLAARLLYSALINGDIAEKSVLDLGCGTGMLSIGAALLGGTVTGVDIDGDALNTAKENAARLKADVSFIMADVKGKNLPDILPHVDTVIMNPPFGAQNEHADRPFIDCAIEMGDLIYGIFNAGTNDFLERYINGRAEITRTIAADLTIPRTFSFHSKDKMEIPVEIFIIEKKQV